MQSESIYLYRTAETAHSGKISEMVELEELVSIPEAARKTGLSPDTLRTWIKKRRFGGSVGKHLGRAYVVNVRAVEEIIRGANGGAKPE